MAQNIEQRRRRLKYYVAGFVAFVCFVVYGVLDDMRHAAHQEGIRGSIANHYIVKTILLGAPTAKTASIFGTLIDVEETVRYAGEKNCWLVTARMNLDSEEWSDLYWGDMVKLRTLATLMPKLLTPKHFIVCKYDSGVYRARFPPEDKQSP